MTDRYPPPVNQLLTLGEPPSGPEWLDYPRMGLTGEHVPALIEMMQDSTLAWKARGEQADETPFWAPLHAWRALGQLRAHAAAEPLVRFLVTQDDDWADTEIPRALAMIGPAALPVVQRALSAAAREPEAWNAAMLTQALVHLTNAHPEVRDQVIAALEGQLRLWEDQTGDLNAWLIWSLIDLKAAEAAPVIQEAYEAAAVEESIVGDWEDTQVALGLRADRSSARRRYDRGFHLAPRPPKTTAPVPGSDSAAAKSRQLRRSQKQGKKKRR